MFFRAGAALAIDLMVASAAEARGDAICCLSVSRWPGKISTEYS